MNNNITNGNYNNSLRKEIVDKVDIVQVINEYVPLTKKGANYIGLCPFHKDTNPSMSVSPTKKVFKCFSCNTGGDVITFVSKIKNITVTQAMRELGSTVGISFKLTKKELEHQKNKKYYEITNEAATFYNFYLERTEEASEARDYVHNRGLNDDVIKRFNIGASGEKDELFNVLENKGFLPLDMIEVNLIRSYANKYQDVFKNRIIFPLENLDGEVVGFSGRRYKANDENSKYLNTTDTVIFKKGNILYNYHNATPFIKDKDCVYLFEGFMDVIAAVRSGVENSVASMGTALTINQIQAIKRYTNNIVVGYDSDGPGVMATLKAIDMLILEGFNIKVVCIPDGKDADEFIFKNGNEALFDCLTNKTINAIDFIYNFNLKYLLKEDVSSVETFKNNIYLAIQKFNSLAITESYLNKLSNEINIPLDSLKSDYEDFNNNHPLVKPNYQYADNQYGESDIPFDAPPIEDYPITDDGFVQTIVTPKQTKDTFDILKKKYIKSEDTLVIASYNSKDNARKIHSELKFNFVDKVNRLLLNSIFTYFNDFEVMEEKVIFKMLDDDEEQTRKLRKLLNDKTIKLPSSVEIDACIKNVKEYQVEATLHDVINGDINKDALDNVYNLKRSNGLKINRKNNKEI